MLRGIHIHKRGPILGSLFPASTQLREARSRALLVGFKFKNRVTVRYTNLGTYFFALHKIITPDTTHAPTLDSRVSVAT